MDENETLDMIMEISGLLIKGLLPPSLAPYYDHDSDEMLEDKLRVLRALDEGQDFDEIQAHTISSNFSPGTIPLGVNVVNINVLG
ncbi:hypothetical protein JS82_05895 [Methanomassiliicoccaceae archaeon DOK]|nr:hypothetical protein JS82_05895 [Methanomassiliicoccaceae archaeon DOK]